MPNMDLHHDRNVGTVQKAAGPSSFEPGPNGRAVGDRLGTEGGAREESTRTSVCLAEGRG